MTEPTPVPTPSDSLIDRLFALLRILQMAIIVMQLFYVGLAELLRRNHIADIFPVFLCLCGFALLDVLIVLYVRNVKIAHAADLLRIDADDQVALMDIRKWYAVALAICAAISVAGFAFRIMGSTFWQAAILYAAGIVFCIYCTPRRPR